MVCCYSNIGKATINFTSSTIHVEPGNTVTESSDSCGGPIGAGQRCRTVSVTIVTNGAHWRRAVIDNKASLRGRMEIRNSSGTVLSTEDIR